MLRAEEYDPDSEEWYEIARDSYYVSTIFDKDAECSHIWEKNKKRDNLRCKNTEVCYNGNVTGKSS